jgi:dTDP-4-dehydrorhamnose 3,5-epimerase-like enzyme
VGMLCSGHVRFNVIDTGVEIMAESQEALARRIGGFLHGLVLLGICATTIYLTTTLWKIGNEPATHVEVMYDCRLAEISVDYPAEVKQKCRKLMTPEVRSVRG